MALPREPERREQRRAHLDASVLPFERALKARAIRLQDRGEAMKPGAEANTLLTLAAEFHELGEELHYW